MTVGAEKSKNLITALSTLGVGGDTQPTRLVLVIRISEREVFLSLKIGASRLYSVKDFAGFFSVIKSGETISFGKNYTFNGTKAEFSGPIHGFINLMTVILEEYSQPGREFALPEKFVLPVMRQLADTETEIYRGTAALKEAGVTVLMPTLEFEVVKQGEYSILRCGELAEIQPLTADYTVILLGGSIHILKKSQAKIIQQLVMASTDGTIVFSGEDKRELITRVLPFVRQVGKVQIDSSIKKDVTVGQLKIKTFLDRTDFDTVAATVRFCYGGEEFNHFLGEKPTAGDKILIRDVRKENEFIRLAGRLGFVPEDGVLYLSDEYKLYDFLSEGIFEMKELSEIFYSDRFNIEVVTPTKGNGGVSLGAGNMLEFNLSVEGIDDEELADIMEAVREKRRFYHLKSGSFVNLEAKPLSQAVKLLESLEADGRSGSVSLARAFFLDGWSDGTIKITGDDRFKAFVKSFKRGETEINIPKHIDSVLRPYQRTGVKWMKSLADRPIARW